MAGTDPVTGRDAWGEVAGAGVDMLRVYPKWNATTAAQQIQQVQAELAAAAHHGLRHWVGLYDIANDLAHRPLLEQVVNGLKGSPGLGAWKGADEPLHGEVPAPGLVLAYGFLRSLDPHHPVVVIRAPRAKGGPATAGLGEPHAG